MHPHPRPRLNATARLGPIMLKLSTDGFRSNDTRRDRTIQDNSSTFQQALYAGFERAGSSADEHRHERRHGTSDHHGHDIRTDPPAHAVRARTALPRMMRHDRSMHRSA